MYGCNFAVEKVTKTQNLVLVQKHKCLFASTLFSRCRKKETEY